MASVHCSRDILLAIAPIFTCITRKNIEEDVSNWEAKKSKEKVVAKNLAQKAYKDAVGPLKYQSLGKSKIFVILFDKYSGNSMVRFLGKNNEAAGAVI